MCNRLRWIHKWDTIVSKATQQNAASRTVSPSFIQWYTTKYNHIQLESRYDRLICTTGVIEAYWPIDVLAIASIWFRCYCSTFLICMCTRCVIGELFKDFDGSTFDYPANISD